MRNDEFRGSFRNTIVNLKGRARVKLVHTTTTANTLLLLVEFTWRIGRRDAMTFPLGFATRIRHTSFSSFHPCVRNICLHVSFHIYIYKYICESCTWSKKDADGFAIYVTSCPYIRHFEQHARSTTRWKARHHRHIACIVLSTDQSAFTEFNINLLLHSLEWMLSISLLVLLEKIRINCRYLLMVGVVRASG